MTIEKRVRDTLLGLELDCGDELRLELADGTVRSLVVDRTWVKIDSTTLAQPKVPERGARTVIRSHVDLRVDGERVSLVRWIGSDRSFAEPYELFGMRLWFDGTADLREILNENHGECLPTKAARFAIQDVSKRICPVLLHPWCPLPEDGLRIADCYDSCDCWMGPYYGADAHGGLDINTPAGTILHTPLAIDEHGFFDHLRDGANNNRWRGLHHWPDGSTWVLQAHHLIRLLVPEGEAIPAGFPYAETGGVLTGSHEHTHFVFAIRDPDGTETLLDPYILFWQMTRDHSAAARRYVR